LDRRRLRCSRTTHLSFAVWRRCFADACGTGHGQSFIPRFLCGARVRLPGENGHVAEPLCADHLCAIIGALFLLYFYISSETKLSGAYDWINKSQYVSKTVKARFRSSFPTP
jgi:hypothetical protein